MKRIQNITNEPIQRHTIVFQESEIVLTLRFYPRTEVWLFDAEYLDWAVYGLKLSVGTLHMISQNQPFDFVVTDESGEGFDPFQRTDFSSGRCLLYLLEPEDMVRIRGDEVPV
jgi:hypothetical protein